MLDMKTPTDQRMSESDVLVHIQDTPLVNAIRDGKLVQVSWNELTEAERRAAQVVMFHNEV